MAFYKTERLALFIDGANLYSAGKTLGVEVDYRKLLEEFRRRGQLVRAYYYTALVENEDYSPIRPLVDWLQYNGFKVVTKPAKEFTDSAGRRRVKGDMDVEITVDMLNLSKHVDHVVLFSGDGDLTRLVEAVQERGVRVSVVSTVKTSPPMISDELRRAADTFIELADLAELVGRPPRQPQTAAASSSAMADEDDEEED
ncbi:MAG TPA: NYN domain-containing protein [Hyphomonadaceae bacterium]|nr:NYN domain-containing protein [Hyphomonadaceae bacterium]